MNAATIGALIASALASRLDHAAATAEVTRSAMLLSSLAAFMESGRLPVPVGNQAGSKVPIAAGCCADFAKRFTAYAAAHSVTKSALIVAALDSRLPELPEGAVHLNIGPRKPRRRIEPELGRLDELIGPPDENGCRCWLGMVFKAHGRPYVMVGGKQVAVSRVVLSKKLGREISDGMHCGHSCDRNSCVAEAHVYETSASGNMVDMVMRGRHSGGKLTPEDVDAIRYDERGCRVLGREYGVDRASIRAIRHFEIWCHLPLRKNPDGTDVMPTGYADWKARLGTRTRPRKLTDGDIDSIRYDDRKSSVIAAEYRVAPTLISRIKHMKTRIAVPLRNGQLPHGYRGGHILVDSDPCS